MKKLFRSFTFWFIILAFLQIAAHQMGQDSKSIILIELNPILNWIADSDGAVYRFMQSSRQIPCNTIAGEISVYWYIGSVATLAGYGALLDCVGRLVRRRSRRG